MADNAQSATKTAKTPLQADSAPSGPAQSGPAPSGPAQSGASSSGPAPSGPAPSGAVASGAASSGAVASTADIDLIRRLIPHRYPFLLVDRVRDIVPGVSAVGIKNVTFNEPQFQGHFPITPIFPGVMIIEALAQTSAVLVGLTLDLVDKNALVYFMGVDQAKFRRKVVPGDVLALQVTVKRGGARVWKFDGRATVDGALAAECEFTAMIDLGKG